MIRSRRVARFALLIGVVAGSSASAQERGTVPPRPAPALPKSFVFPKITVETLPNGLRLAVVENHEVPLVSVKVGSYAGASLDPAGKHGGWALMMNSLRFGTTSRTAAQIADTLEALGTTVTWPLGLTSPTSGIPQYTTAKAVWRPVLDIVADMLMNPSFPEDAVTRLQAQQATSAKLTIFSGAPQTATRLVFGDQHPLNAYPVEADIRGLTRDDIVALQTKYLRPQNGYLVIAGDITPATARAAALKSFGGWKPTGDTVRVADAPPLVPPKATAIYLVDFPGAAAAAVYAAEPLPSSDSPDADALDVVNAVVGASQSGVDSRMYDLFRSKHGLSYAPNSSLLWRTDVARGSWQLTATVPPEKVDSAMVFLLQVVRDLHGEHPITEAELDFAKGNLTRRLPSTMEMVTQQSAAIYGMMFMHRGPDYLQRYADRISAITLDQARATAAKYLDPDHLVLVVAGDRSKMEAALRATGIPVVIIEH